MSDEKIILVDVGFPICRLRKGNSAYVSPKLEIVEPAVADEDGFIPAASIVISGQSNLKRLRDALDDFLDGARHESSFVKLAEAVDETTVDAGAVGNTVHVNKQAYQAMCRVLIDTGYWTQEELKKRRELNEEMD